MKGSLVNTLLLGFIILIKNTDTNHQENDSLSPLEHSFNDDEEEQLSETYTSTESTTIHGQKRKSEVEAESETTNPPKYLKLSEDNTSHLDENELIVLNENLKSFLHRKTKNRNRRLPFLVMKDFRSKEMWLKVTSAFKKIIKSYSKYLLGEETDLDHLEKEHSFESIETVDFFHSSLLNFIKIENFQSDRFKDEFYSLETDSLFSFRLSQRALKTDNAVSFYRAVNSQPINYDLEDLTSFLLYKIATNKMNLVEIKSIILTVFYNFPSDNGKLNSDDHISKLKCLIVKTIILINQANETIYEFSVKYKNEELQSINDFLVKILCYYLCGNRSDLNYLERFRRKKNEIKKYNSLDILVQHDDFIFFCWIFKSLEIVKNFILPVIELQECPDFEKTTFFYLVRGVQRLNKLGDLILKSAKHLNGIET